MNKLIIAAAGSGKTTYLVKESLKIKDEKVLITTFTVENEREIRAKFIKLNGFIPENVTIQTWFSFLLQHGVKPYQDVLVSEQLCYTISNKKGVKPYQDVLVSGKVKGLQLVNCKSGLKYRSKHGYPVYFSEAEVRHYYFNSEMKIYSDKIAKFAFVINKKTNGLIIDRISRIYPHVFIDEVQDLAGYDLELIHLLMKTPSNIIMVGDPRQVTYHTHEEAKNNKYKEGQVEQFIYDKCKDVDVVIDKTSLKTTHRNCKAICTFANSIFPEYEPCDVVEKKSTGHDGVFFIKPADVDEYLKLYCPTQLRYSVATPVNPRYEVLNFGESKGITRDRVLIYPTKPMIKWINDHSSELKFESRSKLYVAVTRAKYSVAIVYDYDNKTDISGIHNFVLR